MGMCLCLDKTPDRAEIPDPGKIHGKSSIESFRIEVGQLLVRKVGCFEVTDAGGHRYL